MLRTLGHHEAVSPAARRRAAAVRIAAADASDDDPDPVPASAALVAAARTGVTEAEELLDSVSAAMKAILQEQSMQEQADGNLLLSRIVAMDQAGGTGAVWIAVATDDELARRMREVLRTTVFRASRNYLLQGLDTFEALEEAQSRLRALVREIDTETVGQNYRQRQEQKRQCFKAMNWVEAKRAQKWTVVVFRNRAIAEAVIDPLQRTVHELALCPDGSGLVMLLYPRVDERDPIVDVERTAQGVRAFSESAFVDAGGDSADVRTGQMAKCCAVAILGLRYTPPRILTDHFNAWHRQGGAVFTGAQLEDETDEELALEAVEYVTQPINPHEAPRMRVHFSARQLFGAIAPKWSHSVKTNGASSDGEGDADDDSSSSSELEGEDAGALQHGRATAARSAARGGAIGERGEEDSAEEGGSARAMLSPRSKRRFELYEYIETLEGMQKELHVLALALQKDALDDFFGKVLVAKVLQLVEEEQEEVERPPENYELTFEGRVHARRSLVSAIAAWPSHCCGKPWPVPWLNLLLVLRAAMYTAIAMQALMPIVFGSSLYLAATRKVELEWISTAELMWYWASAVTAAYSCHFFGHWLSKLVQGTMLIATNEDLATMSGAIQNILSCSGAMGGFFVVTMQYSPYYSTFTKYSAVGSITIMIMQLVAALLRRRQHDRTSLFQNVSCLHEIITISIPNALRARSVEARTLLRKSFATDDAGKGHARLRQYKKFLKRREIVEFKRRGESATWHQLNFDLDEVNGDIVARSVFAQQQAIRPAINAGGTINMLLGKLTVVLKTECEFCSQKFDVINRPGHCFKCGVQLCRKCLLEQRTIVETGYHEPVPVCEFCAADVDEQNAVLDRAAYFQAEHARRRYLVRTYGEAFVKQNALWEKDFA